MLQFYLRNMVPQLRFKWKCCDCKFQVGSIEAPIVKKVPGLSVFVLLCCIQVESWDYFGSCRPSPLCCPLNWAVGIIRGPLPLRFALAADASDDPFLLALSQPGETDTDWRPGSSMLTERACIVTTVKNSVPLGLVPYWLRGIWV